MVTPDPLPVRHTTCVCRALSRSVSIASIWLASLQHNGGGFWVEAMANGGQELFPATPRSSRLDN
jgi:hypothetical protein